MKRLNCDFFQFSCKIRLVYITSYTSMWYFYELMMKSMYNLDPRDAYHLQVLATWAD